MLPICSSPRPATRIFTWLPPPPRPPPGHPPALGTLPAVPRPEEAAVVVPCSPGVHGAMRPWSEESASDSWERTSRSRWWLHGVSSVMNGRAASQSRALRTSSKRICSEALPPTYALLREHRDGPNPTSWMAVHGACMPVPYSGIRSMSGKSSCISEQLLGFARTRPLPDAGFLHSRLLRHAQRSVR